MKNKFILILIILITYISCSENKEIFFNVSNRFNKINSKDSLYINKFTIYYDSKDTIDGNCFCFDILLNNHIAKNIEKSDFNFFIGKNKYELMSMFPPSVSEKNTIYLCFFQSDMNNTVVDNLFDSIYKTNEEGKILLAKRIINKIALVLNCTEKYSLLISFNQSTQYSLYGR